MKYEIYSMVLSLADFCEGILIFLFYVVFNNQLAFIKKGKFRTIIFIFSYTLFGFISYNYMPMALHNVINSIFVIIIYKLILKANIHTSILSTAVYIIYTFFMQLPLILFIVFFSRFYAPINATSSSFSGIMLINYLLQFTGIYILYKNYFRFNYLKIYNLQYSYISNILYICVIIAGLGFTQLNLLNRINNISSFELFTYRLSTFIILIFIFIIILFDLQEREKILKTRYELKREEEHVQNMKKVIDALREYKHDISNHLSTINTMCKINEPSTLERIEEYTSSLTNKLSEEIRFYDTGNKYIDGLLSVKNNEAYKCNINFTVDFGDKLEKIRLSPDDLISIVGNIIDNAIYAIANDSKNNGKKYITISGYIEENMYILSICNNGPVIPKDYVNKIFDNKFTTKKAKEAGHGYGLYITKHLVEKNNGKIHVFSEDAQTEFLIEIPFHS